MMLVGKATGGTLAVYDWADGGLVRRVKEGDFAGVACPDGKAQDTWMCPALVDGRGIALFGPRHQWPSQCRHMSVGSGVVHCLPLVVGGEKVGVVQIGYSGHGPSPPTRYLAALLATADQAALAVRQAWKNLQYQERTLRLRGTLSQEVREGFVRAEGSPERSPQEADGLHAEPVSPFLEIRCFGAFELYRQGKLAVPDMLKRRKAMNLLQILLIHGGRRVSRDALEELLWPEADPEAAANRFYVLVHTLRRLVEPSHQNQHWVFICNDGDRYYFNPGASYRLDIREFREYISLGERQERQGDPSAAVDAYEAAVDLYRGDLLEDESYSEWCCEEREVLKEMYLTTLRRLAGLYLEQSVPEKSVEAYRRALTTDPLREENHQGLMRALWAAGRRDEALRQFQICREVLFRELDVGPLPETEELSFFIREFGER
jgi:DNA-binding SARP family transcriptional activator